MEANIKLALDEECWSCHSYPKPYTLADDGKTCRVCGGGGYTLTNDGEELIKFIVRHWAEIQKAVAKGRS